MGPVQPDLRTMQSESRMVPVRIEYSPSALTEASLEGTRVDRGRDRGWLGVGRWQSANRGSTSTGVIDGFAVPNHSGRVGAVLDGVASWECRKPCYG